jgi:hypothetical protein
VSNLLELKTMRQKKSPTVTKLSIRRKRMRKKYAQLRKKQQQKDASRKHHKKSLDKGYTESELK